MEQTEGPGFPGLMTLGGTSMPLVGRARVYACGITPYDVTHLGHAAVFVWVDTLARVLHDSGAEVIICRNVTDVDDVLLAAAERAGSPYDRFAAIQQFYFDRDMAALGVGQPALQPRAHAYIGQVIALAAGLIQRGAAYARGSQVYFRGAAAALDAMPDRAQALRLATEYGDDPADPAKDDPFDVAVWRASHGGEPGWASPWGTGRPGWHAECAAMALHAFGPAVDVQAGGGDLRFPHHAYQAALAEAFTGVAPFSRTRLNAGVVQVAGPRWPSRRATWSWSASCSRSTPRRPSGSSSSIAAGIRTGSSAGPPWTRPPPGWSGCTRPPGGRSAPSPGAGKGSEGSKGQRGGGRDARGAGP